MCSTGKRRTWRSYYLWLDVWDELLFHSWRFGRSGAGQCPASGLHDNVAEASGSTGLRAMPVGQAKARPMPERLEIANGG